MPKASIVADVNLDMPIITYKFEDVIAFGAERSTLGPIVKAAAAKLGVGFSPDPMPDQGLFVRSDHYRFVQQGIPSVFLWPGTPQWVDDALLPNVERIRPRRMISDDSLARVQVAILDAALRRAKSGVKMQEARAV